MALSQKQIILKLATDVTALRAGLAKAKGELGKFQKDVKGQSSQIANYLGFGGAQHRASELIGVLKTFSPVMLGIGTAALAVKAGFSSLIEYTNTWEGSLTVAGTRLNVLKNQWMLFHKLVTEEIGKDIAEGHFWEIISSYLTPSSGMRIGAGIAATLGHVTEAAEEIVKHSTDLQRVIWETTADMLELRNTATELEITWRDKSGIYAINERMAALNEYKKTLGFILEDEKKLAAARLKVWEAKFGKETMRGSHIFEGGTLIPGVKDIDEYEDIMNSLTTAQINYNQAVKGTLRGSKSLIEDFNQQTKAAEEYYKTLTKIRKDPLLQGKGISGIAGTKGTEGKPAMLESIRISIEKSNEWMEEWKERMQSNISIVGSSLVGFFEGFAGAFTDGKNILQQFLNYFKKWVVSMLLQIAALIAASLVLMLVLPGADVSSLMAATGAATKFGAVFRTLSAGSAVGGAVGLIGSGNPGTSQRVAVSGVLRGGDMYLQNAEYSGKRSRNFGS